MMDGAAMTGWLPPWVRRLWPWLAVFGAGVAIGLVLLALPVVEPNAVALRVA